MLQTEGSYYLHVWMQKQGNLKASTLGGDCTHGMKIETIGKAISYIKSTYIKMKLWKGKNLGAYESYIPKSYN